MKLYATSKNVGTTEEVKPVLAALVYLGDSVQKAEDAVGTFSVYAKEEMPSESMLKAYSALPWRIKREMVEFFQHGDRWYSIEMFDIPDPSQ